MSAKPTTPDIQTIRKRMEADTAYYLPSSGNRPRKSLLTVLNTVFAGAIWSVYGYADWILKQIDPLTADEVFLKVWGAKLGVPRKAATTAIGAALFTGDPLVEIPAGTLIQTPDGRRYITSADTLPPYPVKVEAESAGYDHNLPVKQSLKLVNPITDISLELTAGPITGGSDQETLLSWANRINEKIDQTQEMGDSDDYIRWTKAAHTSIIDAWVYSNTPRLGDVSIYCLLEKQADIQGVFAVASKYIESQRNVGANIFLKVPLSLPVDIRISIDELTDMDEEIKSVIGDDINTLIEQKRKRHSYLYPEEIERVINTHFSQAYTLLSPNQKVVTEPDEIITLGTINYV